MDNGIRMESKYDKSNDQQRVCSVREIAEYLGLSESKVRQFIRRNAIPYLKLDGSYKFYLPTIQNWLKRMTVEPKPESDSDRANVLANQIWDSKIGE